MTQKLCNDRKGYDKVFHMALSFGLGCVLAGLLSFIPWGAWTSAIVVFALVMAVGIGKELKDRRKPGGHFCVWDIVADFIGALASTPIAYFANYFTNIE